MNVEIFHLQVTAREEAHAHPRRAVGADTSAGAAAAHLDNRVPLKACFKTGFEERSCARTGPARQRFVRDGDGASDLCRTLLLLPLGSHKPVNRGWHWRAAP